MSEDQITPLQEARIEAEIDRYLDKAEAVIARQREIRTLDAPECRACRFCEPQFVSDVCTHPVVTIEVANQSDHYRKNRIRTCEEQRDEESHYGTTLCGPQAALFQPIPEERPTGLLHTISSFFFGDKK